MKHMYGSAGKKLGHRVQPFNDGHSMSSKVTRIDRMLTISY